jgi:hypothetical protein
LRRNRSWSLANVRPPTLMRYRNGIGQRHD